MFRTRTLLFALALCTVAPSTALALAPQPADVINGFHTTLSDAMNRSAKLGCEGRTKLVTPAVDQTFDLPFLAERVMRRFWKSLDAGQRDAFLQSLRSSVIATYATEFSQAGSVNFETRSTESLANGDAVVHAVLTPKDRGPVTLDYVLKPRGDSWQVVNVLAEGVSDLALRATQYDGLMKTEGFDALVTKLETQTQKLKARCP